MWRWRKPTASLERVVVLDEWPQPAVVAEPRLIADDHEFSLIYRSTGDDIAVVCSRYRYLSVGAPNDEALGGHPLAKSGLRHYSVHEVYQSQLIQELERRNSIHPRHSPSLFRDLKHLVFTFQDNTLECVVTVGKWAEPRIAVFDKMDEAEAMWKERLSTPSENL
jgi:hypothetical protein